MEINDRRQLQDGIIELLENMLSWRLQDGKSNLRTKSHLGIRLSPTFYYRTRIECQGRPVAKKDGGKPRPTNRVTQRAKPSLRRSVQANASHNRPPRAVARGHRKRTCGGPVDAVVMRHSSQWFLILCFAIHCGRWRGSARTTALYHQATSTCDSVPTGPNRDG